MDFCVVQMLLSLQTHASESRKKMTANLRVSKEEGDLLVLKASLEHEFFNILSPLCSTIVLRWFNLETLIPGPEYE